MKFLVEIEREEDGRWIADVPELPGVMAYGKTSTEAAGKAQNVQDVDKISSFAMSCFP